MKMVPTLIQMLSEKEALKKKVFEACHNMELKNKKITRREVRKITGGSDRDLSKYIFDYHESKKMVPGEEVLGTELIESGTNDGTNNERELVQDDLSGTNDGTNNESELVQNDLSGTNGGTNNERELVQNDLSGTNDGTDSGNLVVQNDLSGTISNTEDEIIEETNVYFEQPVNEMEAIARRLKKLQRLN